MRDVDKKAALKNIHRVPCLRAAAEQTQRYRWRDAMHMVYIWIIAIAVLQINTTLFLQLQRM